MLLDIMSINFTIIHLESAHILFSTLEETLEINQYSSL